MDVKEIIFASKLYQNSVRKDKIKSALDDPLNSELVIQLKSYLDDEYQDVDEDISEVSEESAPDDELVEEEAESSEDNEQPSSESEDSSEERIRPSHVTHSPSPKPADHHLSEMLDEGDDATNESVNSAPADKDEPKKSDNVEESTKINSSSIVGSSWASGCTTCNKDNYSLDAILGLLNSRQDTCGVRRVVNKHDNEEIWIYYNDDINLDKVMENVISLLSSTSYTSLNFNRLARTENAIVFSIERSASQI